MNETQVAGFLRNIVETVYEKVDDVDGVLGSVSDFAAGAIEALKQGLVEADKALADYDKTDEVNLGADLADDRDSNRADAVDKHDFETELSTEEKLHALQDAADEYFGQGSHLWWIVKVTDTNRESIEESYQQLVDGELWSKGS